MKRSVTIFWATCSGCHKTKPLNPRWLVSYRGGVMVDARCDACSALGLALRTQCAAPDSDALVYQPGGVV